MVKKPNKNDDKYWHCTGYDPDYGDIFSFYETKFKADVIEYEKHNISISSKNQGGS